MVSDQKLSITACLHRAVHREVRTQTVTLVQIRSHSRGCDISHVSFPLLRQARFWVQVMRDLREGVKLKKVQERQYNPLPIEYQLTPYEMLMDDIRSKRYKLRKVMVRTVWKQHRGLLFTGRTGAVFLIMLCCDINNVQTFSFTSQQQSLDSTISKMTKCCLLQFYITVIEHQCGRFLYEWLQGYWGIQSFVSFMAYALLFYTLPCCSRWMETSHRG